MEPHYVFDYGHHTAKCGRVYAGKGAATKAARAAAAAGSSIVVHAPSSGLAGGRITSTSDELAHLLTSACESAAAEAGPSSGASAKSIDLTSSGLSILVPLSMARADLEQLTQVAFESLRVKRFYVAAAPAAALCAAGVTSGTVVDSGAWESRVVPVHESLPVHRLAMTTPRGGQHHAMGLHQLLLAASPELAKVPRHEFESRIDAAKAALPWSVAADGASDETVTLQLPDGENVETSTAIAVPKRGLDAVARRLFDLRWAGNDGPQPAGPPLVTALKATLRQASLEVPEAARDVVVSGGPSLIAGTEERIKGPLAPVASSTGDGAADEREPPFATTAGVGSYATLRHVRDRQNAAWAGASILCQLSSFNAFTVDVAAYNSDGPACVRQCLV